MLAAGHQGFDVYKIVIQYSIEAARLFKKVCFCRTLSHLSNWITVVVYKN